MQYLFVLFFVFALRYGNKKAYSSLLSFAESDSLCDGCISLWSSLRDTVGCNLPDSVICTK
jgi:hypothetical protein